MKILAICDKPSGTDYHRIIKPLQRMQVDYYGQLEISLAQDIKNNGLPELRQFDVVVFNRYLFEYHYPVLEYMAQNKVPYVVDIDDFWKLPKHHGAFDYYRKNKLPQAIVDAIRYANVVTCSTEQLAAEIRPINPKVRILPNALDTTDEQWNQPKKPSDKYRFGYMAGVTHYNDMLIMSQAISDICREYGDKVEFIYGGYGRAKNGDKIPEIESMLNRFNNNESRMKDQIKIIMAAKPENYGAMYANIDCALAPLEDSHFARCKSDLKIQEAAAYGLPIICSNVMPFAEHLNNPGIRFAENGDWYNAMVEMIETGGNGRSNQLYMEQCRDLETINKKRLEAFQWAQSSTIPDPQ